MSTTGPFIPPTCFKFVDRSTKTLIGTLRKDNDPQSAQLLNEFYGAVINFSVDDYNHIRQAHAAMVNRKKQIKEEQKKAQPKCLNKRELVSAALGWRFYPIKDDDGGEFYDADDNSLPCGAFDEHAVNVFCVPDIIISNGNVY